MIYMYTCGSDVIKYMKCILLLEQVHEVSDEVSLAQQQVSPHGLQVLQQQVVAVEDVQQVFAGVKVSSVDLLLKRPLQVGQQLCSYGRGWRWRKVFPGI